MNPPKTPEPVVVNPIRAWAIICNGRINPEACYAMDNAPSNYDEEIMVEVEISPVPTTPSPAPIVERDEDGLKNRLSNLHLCLLEARALFSEIMEELKYPPVDMPIPTPWCPDCGTYGHTSGDCPQITKDQMKDDVVCGDDLLDQKEIRILEEAKYRRLSKQLALYSSALSEAEKTIQLAKDRCRGFMCGGADSETLPEIEAALAKIQDIRSKL